MKNSDSDFFGKQTGERILYVVRPHHLASSFNLLKIYVISLAVFVAFFFLGSQLQSFSSLFFTIGVVISAVMMAVGTKLVRNYQGREVAYITDRRLVRFEPTTFVATNSRAITWDEVVKVKTYPPNFLWKQFAIGNVVVHARTPSRSDALGHSDAMADDIELRDVFYYRDLGNYIDKILFIYKQKPREMDEIRPFVPRPRGERY